MKIAILAVGTMRDVRPCVLLAKRLITKKHNVTVIAFDVFKEYILGQGVQFVSYPCDCTELANCKYAESVSEVMSYIKKLSSKDSERLMSTLLEACIDSDVLLYTDKSLGMVYIGESLQIPYIRLSLIPDAPTGEYRCIYSRDWRFGNLFRRAYNRMTHRRYINRLVKIQKSTKKSWLKPLEIKNKYKLGRKYLDGSGIENLHMYSEIIVPECDDLGENVHAVGYFSEGDGTYTPSQSVERLFSSDAPVYVDSNLASDEYGYAISTVLEAVKLAGKRAILGGGEMPEKLPQNAVFVKDAPVEWLISRCEAVIQCGGAELTAKSLTMGKPTLVIPIGNERVFWGNRVYERGLGPKPILPKKLTAVKLAEAIEELCSPEYTERAEYVGKLLKAEDGIGRAVDFIEKEYGEQ